MKPGMTNMFVRSMTRVSAGSRAPGVDVARAYLLISLLHDTVAW